MQSGPSDYTSAVPLASFRETLAEGGGSQVQSSHTRAPFQSSDRSLSHRGVFSCVSNFSLFAQPRGLPRHETQGKAGFSYLLPSVPRSGVEQCLEESPTEEQIVPGPALSSQKRRPRESPGSSLLSSPRRNSVGQRPPTAELPKPWRDALAKAEPSSEEKVEATNFRLCF